jgi:hypothetical protein
MGAGGNITLINNTDCDWNQTDQHSYQMNHWSFPQTIAAGTSCSIYLEYSEHVDKDWTDDGGDVIYQLTDGSGSSFHIHASHPHNYAGSGDITVTFQGITTPKYPAGSTLDLGFAWNGQSVFFLACENGTYYIGDLIAPQVDS